MYNLATVTVANNANVTAVNFEIASAGILTGPGALTLSGQLTWIYGKMTGSGSTSLAPGASATLGNDPHDAGFPVTLDQRTLNINKQGNNPAGLTLGGPQGGRPIEFEVDNGAVINNYGTFTVKDDSSIKQHVGSGTLINKPTGTWQKTGGTGTTVISVTFTDQGTYHRLSGTVDFQGPLSMLEGLFDIGGGTVLAEAGFEQDGGTTALNGGTFTITGAFPENGGSVTLGGGTLSTSGGVQIASGASLSGSGEVVGSISDAGTVSVATGTLTVNGSYTQTTGGATTVTGSTLSVSGAVDMQAGTFTVALATVAASSGMTVEQGATLYGNATFNVSGSLTNDGVINIAGGSGPGSSPGALIVSGNYTQNSTGELDILLYDASDYDTLQVSGVATLGGTLNVIAMNGFTPGIGQVYKVVTYGTLGRAFDMINEPGLSSGEWSNRYDDPAYPNSLTLWVIP